MVQHKYSDQYLASGKVSIRSIHGFKRYRLLKTLTKNFNRLSNADADADVEADADAVVTAIALLVLTYRRTKNENQKRCIIWLLCGSVYFKDILRMRDLGRIGTKLWII